MAARRARWSIPAGERPRPSVERVSHVPGPHVSSMPPSLTTSVVENGIIAAAMKVFARRGFAGTRVEDVLDEAGIARRTFYRYFTSKEDVLAAGYELATRELLRAIDAIADRAEGDVAAAVVGVELFLDFHVENASLLRVLSEEAVRSESPLAEHRRRLRSGVLRLFARAHEGRSAADADFTDLALASALEGVALALLEQPSAKDVERAKAALRALVEGALR